MLRSGLVLALLVGAAVALEGFDLPINGVVDPPAHYQRYRRDEYPTDKPFFQWWYYWIRDLQENQHYFLTYAVSFVTGSNQTNAGSYFMLGSVDGDTGARFVKVVRYGTEDITVKDNFTVTGGLNGDVSFSLTPDESSNTIHLYGTMMTADNVWRCDNCSASLPIQWNMTAHRLFGWYAQPLFEEPDRIWGDIMWNTYCHDAMVEGTITIGDAVIDLSDTTRYRLYGDMNWGEQFPMAPAHKDDSEAAAPGGGSPTPYAWGWYSVVIPGASLSEEISVIAGTGLTYVGFPWETMLGQFANVRVGALSIQMIEVGLEALTPLDHNVTTTNDGDFVSFDVYRSEWVTFTDQYGSAEIPLVQQVVLATTQHVVNMTFTSKPDEYNRLMFATQDVVFSDFEALGAQAAVTITEVPSNKVLVQFVGLGGVEFGYHVSPSA